MPTSITRREFVKDATLASAATLGWTAAAAETAGAAPPPLPHSQESLPLGKIGNQEFSRLMLGGNLISGYSHSRDLPYVANLMRRYNTEGKILETLELAETHGINAINSAVWDDNSFLQKHWKRGGKMKWIAQALPGEKGELTQFQQAIDQGAVAVHIQGHGAETLVEAGKTEALAKIVEFVKARGVLAGIGAHWLDVVVQCEKAKVNPDFYQKTLHTHQYRSAPRPDETGYLGAWDNSWCNHPDEVVDVMWAVKKPWIAFKVMAAGAIPPRAGFQFAFNSGADFVLAGMFDWQVTEDVKTVKEVLANVSRTRPWMA